MNATTMHTQSCPCPRCFSCCCHRAGPQDSKDCVNREEGVCECAEGACSRFYDREAGYTVQAQRPDGTMACYLRHLFTFSERVVKRFSWPPLHGVWAWKRIGRNFAYPRTKFR